MGPGFGEVFFAAGVRLLLFGEQGLRLREVILQGAQLRVQALQLVFVGEQGGVLVF